MSDQDLLVLKDKVQRYLSEMVGVVQVDEHGNFTVQSGSTRVFVECRKLGEERTAVSVFVPILLNCPPSQELFHYIATHAGDYLFGHLSAHERDGTVDVLFTHGLLGDFLDPEELQTAVAILATVGDELDNQLQPMFGGQRFHEEVA
jgi:hypothetical protein